MKYLLFLLVHPFVSFAQFAYPYEDYKEGDQIYYHRATPERYRPEKLGLNDQQFIADSVQRSLIRYKIRAYSTLYRLDSIFPDSTSKAEFLQNPYMLEYPELKGYTYHPEYLIGNLSYSYDCGFRKGFFDVTSIRTTFIRKHNPELGIMADTIVKYVLKTNACGYLDRNTIVFFHTPTKTLHILGGCLDVDDLKEHKQRYTSTSNGWVLSDIYAQSRTAGISQPSCDGSEFEPWAFKNCDLDSIGSMKLGKSEDGYRYFRIFREHRCFSNCHYIKDASSIYTLGWLIKLRIPKTAQYALQTHSTDLILIQTAEQWDDIEAIQFVSDTRLVDYSPGYIPGFKGYERRVRFKKKPTPADSNIQVRGLTDKEIKELRKIDCLRPFRPAIWDSY